MLTMEYSYEKDMQVKQEEAREEGRAEERETMAIRLIKVGKLSITEISLCTGLSEDKVKELEEENGL
ncbi:MAG: hypothetical protein ACI4F9_09945 [Lachnospiraceae bacterium]